MRVQDRVFAFSYCIVVSLACLALTRTVAQAQSATAELSGRVTQAGDSTITVGGASIELTGTGRRTYADRDGRFTLGQVPAGDYELRARRLGYQPVTRRITVVAGVDRDESIELPRLAGALTAVRIEGRMMKVPARFEDVYRRGAAGWGKFITREMIDSLQPFDTKRLFEGIPSVRVNDRGITFDKCPNQPSNKWLSNVQVYVDGDRRTRLQKAERLDPRDLIPTITDDANDVLKSIRPFEIQAMEIYTGTARIPGEFNNDACAVVAIWTKSY
jgi:hypothetical protein